MTQPSSALARSIQANRVALGISREAMALRLHVPIAYLEAVEEGAWDRLPPGLERPLTRQLADILEVKLADYLEDWEQVPGMAEQDALDPRILKAEKILVAILGLACVGLVYWLLRAGPPLKPNPNHQILDSPKMPATPTLAGAAPIGPYAVLGEFLPEGAQSQGILVLIRAQAPCDVILKHAQGEMTHRIDVSEPWRLHVQGAFSLFLSNAGVCHVEIAGIPIQHGGSVGESWKGFFDPQGRWLRPKPPQVDTDVVDEEAVEEEGEEPPQEETP